MVEQEVHHAVGKRKKSVARVWMKLGTGRIIINKKLMDEYITRESDKLLINQPLELSETQGKYDITVNVMGGGITGQAGAIRHGITRTLVAINPEYRLIFKKAELLTRDPRMKERKKYGQPGARKRYQYSKR